jgi:hypothetical protein
MKYFKDNYRSGTNDTPDKFCLFVLPEGYPYKNAATILERVGKYVAEKNDAEKVEKLKNAKDHIDLFLELDPNRTALYGTLGNTNNYINNCCEKGHLFYNAGITFGHQQIKYEPFGAFPQKLAMSDKILKDTVNRDADKKPTLYAPVEWLVISNNILLSRKLLFAIDYLSLQYPLKKTVKTIEEQIINHFKGYFRQDDDKREITAVRFLSEEELKTLLRRHQKQKMRREVLLPEATDFAQITSRKDAPAFWLAGDMNDARRVDAATESLSDQKAGVELYYVRIVIEVEKKEQ